MCDAPNLAMLLANRTNASAWWQRARQLYAAIEAHIVKQRRNIAALNCSYNDLRDFGVGYKKPLTKKPGNAPGFFDRLRI